MEPCPIDLLLVEADPTFRSLVTAAVRRAPHYHLETADLDGWLAHVREHPPAALLLDLTSDPATAAQLHRLVTGPAAADVPPLMVAALAAPPALEAEAATRRAGAFVCYEKRDMYVRHLAGYLDEDLELFRRGLAGERVAPPSCRDRFARAVATPARGR